MSNSAQPQRWQPTRLPRPWDSPGKNTGVGCHFLLQCVKVKSLSRVRLFATPWTAAHQSPPSMGFSRQGYWSGLPLPFPCTLAGCFKSYPLDIFLRIISFFQSLKWKISTLSLRVYITTASSCLLFCDSFIRYESIRFDTNLWCFSSVSEDKSCLLDINDDD